MADILVIKNQLFLRYLHVFQLFLLTQFDLVKAFDMLVLTWLISYKTKHFCSLHHFWDLISAPLRLLISDIHLLHFYLLTSGLGTLLLNIYFCLKDLTLSLIQLDPVRDLILHAIWSFEAVWTVPETEKFLSRSTSSPTSETDHSALHTQLPLEKSTPASRDLVVSG